MKKINDEKFIEDYLGIFREVLARSDIYEDLYAFSRLCRQVKANGKKLIFAGNGASASISSHAATDFTQHGRVRTICFNDHNLITCFANDYGYENWVAQALAAYADPGDVVVLISSSGRSPNIVNAAKYALDHGLHVVTFSGFAADNPLRELGVLNLWVDSHIYNVVESSHLMWILSVANMLEQNGDSASLFAGYFNRQAQALFEFDHSDDLIQFKNLCIEVSARGGKMMFAGNGGSASIASHAAADFTKQSNIRTVAFNDHNLMSAYANDYGQEHWIGQCLKDYADSGDAIVLLSCSGQSKNVLNAAAVAKGKGFPVVTFTGFKSENTLRTLGQLNFWVDSLNYNITEAIHSVLIFCVGDMLAEQRIFNQGAQF